MADDPDRSDSEDSLGSDSFTSNRRGRRRRRSSPDASLVNLAAPQPVSGHLRQPAELTEIVQSSSSDSYDPSQEVLIPFELNGETFFRVNGTNFVVTASDLAASGLFMDENSEQEEEEEDDDEDEEDEGDDGEDDEAVGLNDSSSFNSSVDVEGLLEFSANTKQFSHYRTQYSSNIFSLLDNRCRIRRGPPTPWHDSLFTRHFLPSRLTASFSYDQRAFCGKFSLGGEIFCGASQDGLVHLYSTDDWHCLKEIQARDVGWSIVDIDFSPDEKFIIYSSWSESVHLCNVSGEFELHEPLNFEPVGQPCMFGIRFSPANQEILAGLNEGGVILYDIERKRRLAYFQGHQEDVNTVAYLEDSGNLFVTGSDDKLLKVWDKRLLALNPELNESGRRRIAPVGSFIGHFAGITCVSPLPGGFYLLSNSKDQSMKLWDLRKFNNANEVADYEGECRTNPALQTRDYRWHRFRRRDVARLSFDRSLVTFVGHAVHQTLVRCDFSPKHSTNHQFAYTGSSDGKIYVYDTLTGTLVTTIGKSASIVRDVSWHPHKPLLVSSSWDCSVRRYELEIDRKGWKDVNSHTEVMDVEE